MEITRCTSEKGKEHNPIELELQASGDHSAGARFLFFSSGAGFYPSEQDKEYQYTTTISLDDVFQILLAIQKRLDSIPRNEMDSIPRNEMDSIKIFLALIFLAWIFNEVSLYGKHTSLSG